MLINNRMLIICYDSNKKQYYHKIVKCSYKRYQVGEYNQYGHKIVYMLALRDIKKLLERG